MALYANENSKKLRWFSIVLLILSFMITFIMAMWWISRGHEVSDKKMFAYCAPWVIISSIALFAIFKNISISSHWI